MRPHIPNRTPNLHACKTHRGQRGDAGAWPRTHRPAGPKSLLSAGRGGEKKHHGDGNPVVYGYNKLRRRKKKCFPWNTRCGLQSAHKRPLGAREGYGQPLVPRAGTNQWGGSGGLMENNFPSRLCHPLALVSPGCCRGTPQHPWVQVWQGVTGACGVTGWQQGGSGVGVAWGAGGCAGVGGEWGGSEDGERQDLAPACPHVLPLQARGLEGGQGSAASSTRPDSAPSLPLAQLLAARGERGRGQGRGRGRTWLPGASPARRPMTPSSSGLASRAPSPPTTWRSVTGTHSCWSRYRRPQPHHVPSPAVSPDPLHGDRDLAALCPAPCHAHGTEPGCPGGRTPMSPVPGP